MDLVNIKKEKKRKGRKIVSSVVHGSYIVLDISHLYSGVPHLDILNVAAQRTMFKYSASYQVALFCNIPRTYVCS
jgi:hypothetical protein